MPSKIETTVFSFDELSDRAKERARDWMRQGAAEFFSDDAEILYDDFQACAERIGITFSTHAVKLMGGSTRRDPDIFWSGFSSQGDGASFAGHYAFKAGGVRAIRAYAPKDDELQRIVVELYKVQRRNFYSVTASISAGRSMYSHSHTMDIEVEAERGNLADEDVETVRECMRDFADWMYKQLETEYEYRLSDEAIDDGIKANEYTFTEDGERFG